MTAILHPECETRLLSILEAALINAIVDHGKFLNSSSLKELYEGDEALPIKVRRQFAEWTTDNPFSSFIYSLLFAKVAREFEYQSGTTVRLVDLPGYSDISVLAQDLLTAFRSLPWRYTLLFPLNLGAHEESNEATRAYRLTDNASLVAPGPEFASIYPLLPDEGPMSLIFPFDYQAGPRKWNTDRYYLKLEIEGFIEDFAFSRPIEEASIFLRSFAGLLLSTPGARSTTAHSIAPMESPFFTYRSDPSGNHLLRSHMLASEYSEKVRTVEWTGFNDLRGAHWPGLMQFLLGRLSLALNVSHEQSAVRRAAQWYFDSQCGGNELLQFVQATVAIEILLGDKASSDVVGISELLANRCAYLLADSHHDRESILREVKALYDTRSKIVHRGKHRLTMEETRQLIDLRYYCRRVIAKELELLAKDHQASA